MTNHATIGSKVIANGLTCTITDIFPYNRPHKNPLNGAAYLGGTVVCYTLESPGYKLNKPEWGITTWIDCEPVGTSSKI